VGEIEAAAGAIVSAQLAGYERLREADAEAARETLREYCEAATDLAGERGGVPLDSNELELVVQFAGAYEAASAALAIQAELDHRNAELPLDRILSFRTGVAAGDDPALAAALAERAPPGGICVSDLVHDAVKARIPARFDELGEQELCASAEPVLVWQMQGSEPRVATRRARRRRAPVAIGALLLLVSVGVATVLLYPAAEPDITPSAAETERAGAVSEPDAEPLLLALGVSPETATPAARRALLEVFAGQPETALQLAARAARADFSATLPVFTMGLAHRALGEFPAAASAFEATLDRDPKLAAARVALIATRVEQDEPDLARSAAARLRRDWPAFDAADYAAGLPFADPAERERLVAALRSAGLD
jgi:tetratricopeptide (TPR) repeat protein